jgi:hypothetical protein
MKRLILGLLLWCSAAFAQTDGRMQFSFLRAGWSASNAVHDASGRRSPSNVATGVTFLAGGQYYFNANSTSNIQSVAPFIMASQQTFTVVCAFAVTNPAEMDLFSEGSSASAVQFSYLDVFQSNLLFAVRQPDNITRMSLQPTNVLSSGWHFAWVEKTGSVARIGLDGVVIGVSNNPAYSSPVTNLNQQFVGVFGRNMLTLPFRGVIEFVSGYSPALSDAEKSALYQRWRASKP